MHDHDTDLIAAFADGIAGDGEDQARQLVESCSDCRAEFERQTMVRTWLGAAPPVGLTSDERTQLYRSVHGRLPVDRTATHTQPGWGVRWLRIASVAAGMLVLVGVGAGLTGLVGGAGDAGGDLAAGYDETSTTAAAAEDVLQAGAPEQAELPSGAPEAGALADAGRVAAAAKLGRVDALTVLVDALREERAGAPTGDGATFDTLSHDDLRCLPADATVLTAVSGTVDGIDYEAYLIDAPGEPVKIFDLPDCRPIPIP